MAIKVDKPGRTAVYTLKRDREASDPTRFTLRPLTWQEVQEFSMLSPYSPEQAAGIAAATAAALAEGRELNVEEIAAVSRIAPANEREHNMKVVVQYAHAVRHGVVRIDGLQDNDGNALRLSGTEFARHGDPNDICELGAEILKMTRLGETAAKN